jgi:hypothetical protein
MVCRKCEDIHTAQVLGRTSSPCKCSCHESPDWVVDYTTATSDGNIETLTSCSIGGCETFRL